MSEKLVVRGAREHNLKNVNLELPRDQLVVFTGLSGSGKSSLAFDTIYAEGQRRYVESLSTYARQFLGRLDRPAVERFVYKMDRAAGPLRSVVQSLSLRCETGKCRKQTRVDIEDTSAIGVNEVTRKHTHVAREANDVDLVFA
jgi:energy-coupling factor transporter ATP-binding protein EcfA2